jgi:DNA-directed RNA polymerase specialized sigma24 family protein
MGQMASPERVPGKTYETGALASWHQEQVPEVANTDGGLMQRINSRDETALAILYDRHTAMVYSVVRPILAEEGAARDIIPQVFYCIWLKASDFKPAGNAVPEFLKTIARKCAYDQFLEGGFENGGLLSGEGPPAFNVDLMTRVRKIMAELPRSEGAPVEIEESKDSDWVQEDRRSQELILGLKGKIKAALKALRDLPLRDPVAVDTRKQEKP